MTRSLRKYIIVCIILVINYLQINSQVLEPVKWFYSSKRISATEAELIFTAKIDKKWHVYSQFIAEGGPIATKFDITKSGDFELVGLVSEYPKPIEEFDKSFEMKLKYFNTKAVFTQKIKILNQSPFTIKGNLEFMCCDDQRCLPPADKDLNLKLINMM
jgi:hypothetical protein